MNLINIAASILKPPPSRLVDYYLFLKINKGLELTLISFRWRVFLICQNCTICTAQTAISPSSYYYYSSVTQVMRSIMFALPSVWFMCQITPSWSVTVCQCKFRQGAVKVPTSLRRSWFDTIITLGGSPTAVAAPPMLVKITSAIRTCLGSRLSTSHNLQNQTETEKPFSPD